MRLEIETNKQRERKNAFVDLMAADIAIELGHETDWDTAYGKRLVMRERLRRQKRRAPSIVKRWRWRFGYWLQRQLGRD